MIVIADEVSGKISRRFCNVLRARAVRNIRLEYRSIHHIFPVVTSDARSGDLQFSRA
jgi:hypothetical protein